jgi:CHAD domain-containing protein
MMVKRKPDDSIRIYAAGLILQQLDALAAEIDGVKSAKDIENVHRMRVSSRRLRAILEVFQDCLPSKRGLIWQDGVKKITNALGSARDTDVQIESISSIYNQLPDPSMRSGIRRLLLRLKQKRTKLQDRVIDRITEFEKSGLMEEMRTAFITLATKNNQVYLYTPDLYKLSFEKIQTAYKIFSSFEDEIMDPQKIEELHAMRVAGKNFRYILECFSSLYSNGLKDPVNTMKNAQDLLGNIHDCDMWTIELPDFLEKERNLTRAYFGNDRNSERFKSGIQYLMDLKKLNREQYYRSFIEKWQHWKEEHIWDSLMKTLQVPFFQEKEMTPLKLIEKLRYGETQ